MKKLLILSLFISTYSLGMDDPFQCKVPTREAHYQKPIALPDYDQPARLERLKEKLIKKYDLYHVHPTIQKEVDKALKVCNITGPIIVLQDQTEGRSRCLKNIVDEQWYEIPVLVIGVEDSRGSWPLSLIKTSLYHECGHLALGHVKTNVAEAATRLSGDLALIALTTSKLYSITKQSCSKPVAGLAAITGGLASSLLIDRIWLKTIDSYKQRKMEHEADIFMCKKLIEQGDITSLADDFIDYTWSLDKNKTNSKNEFWLFHDHPSYKQRAECILKELVNAGFDFKNLPLFDTDGFTKEDIQRNFTKQVQKYFPEYLSATH